MLNTAEVGEEEQGSCEDGYTISSQAPLPVPGRHCTKLGDPAWVRSLLAG